MKLELIKASNMIAVKYAAIKLNKPVGMVCGSTESGKSSICQGIKHALVGESTRVSLKKDLKYLINDSDEKNKVGYTYVEYDGGKQASITIPNGAHEIKEQMPAALPYLLDSYLFASLSESQKRKFLFEITSTRTNPKEIIEKLIKRGCNAQKADSIAPFLLSGFDNAHKQATEHTKEARASWKAITGEVYGDKKAEGWKPVVEDVEQIAIDSMENKIQALDIAIVTDTEKLGSLKQLLNSLSKREEEISDLTAKSEKMERIQKKLETDKNEYQAWEKKVAETKALAEGSKTNAVALKCPECDAELILSDGKLQKREGDLHGCEDASIKLPEYEECLKILGNAVKNGERDLIISQTAKEKLDELLKESTEVISQERITLLEDEISAARKEKTLSEQSLAKLREQRTRFIEAESTAKKAAGYHKDVQEWDQIAAALSPEGIPGEILESTIKPINDRLEVTSKITGWKLVIIGSDMIVRYDGRPHSLSSKSGEWRTNAMITEAISYVSGIKFFMLDGFDILDPDDRGNLIMWLDDLADAGAIDTALIFGTLKSEPLKLPTNLESFWIENGMIGKMEVA